MALTFVLAACVVFQTGTTEYQEPEAEINWTTNTDAENYFNSNLKIPRLRATPEWTQAQENPPLSARKAIVAAGLIMGKLAPYGPGAKLAPPTLKLRENNGRWFWVVYFTPEDGRRFNSTFPVVVLMDGTAIEPQRIPPPPARLGDQ